MTEHMFESIGVQQFYMEAAPILALYNAGRTTGVVLDVGDGQCTVATIYEGFRMYHATQTQVSYSGNDLTRCTAMMLGPVLALSLALALNLTITPTQ